MVVELSMRDGEVVDRLVTHLLRLDDPDPGAFPLGVALVVPVHARPRTRHQGRSTSRAFDPLAVDGRRPAPPIPTSP